MAGESREPPRNNPPATGVTRLAPSPTGALHLGNARTFVLNWVIARQHGWRIVMRIEDLDTPRTKAGTDQQAIEDLQWLGMDWDETAPHQLDDLTPYRDALSELEQRGLTYPCTCLRSDIRSAQSAPHGDEHELHYPGTCRGRAKPQAAGSAIRVMIPDEEIEFTDALHGVQTFNVQHHVGDFVVQSKAGLPAYQLAVVVDDARQGVTDVVRGDDLLSSTARQLWLYRLLDLPPPPGWLHLPLVLGPDGRRLAKRHGDTRVAACRAAGVNARRVIGLIAHWSGATDTRCEMTIDELVDVFSLDALPRGEVTFTADEHAWLMDDCSQ
jgi:glutamyl-tRNA synthetase